MRGADREAGTVLISTLLVLSLMSAVALGLIATLRLSTQKAQVLAETAQADLYAHGAEEFARALMDQLQDTDADTINAQLRAAEPILLLFENGSIALSIRDGSHCLRLDNLVASGENDGESAVSRLQSLMTVLGVSPGDAARLANSAADWVDADSITRSGGAEDGTYLFRDPPHRTANVPFASVSELRAIEGMTEEIFQLLRPHVCIGETGKPMELNINTAGPEHLPVLAAILRTEENDPIALAQEALTLRPPEGYASADQLPEALRLPGDTASEDGVQQITEPVRGIALETDRIEVEALINFGGVQRARVFGFEGVSGSQARLTYRDWGRAAFRPTPAALNSDTAVQ